ncbi:sensor histidine kinase [Ohtaekwangia sp.]|uniref:sensor histidine kinase n=1 Tax=Ohtaekwangia sp. TaxID=2066019 RepID=UPI002FDCCA60
MDTNTPQTGMEHLVLVVQQLSLARDLDTVMKIVRTAARKLTGADGATFVLKDKDKCYYADEDAISPLWKGNRFPLTSCISGWAMLNKRPVAIEDIYQDNRIPHDAYRPTFVKSLAMVPIRTIEPIGAIGNYWANHHQTTEDEVKLLQSLADITAVTMENVNVYNELEQRVKDRTADLEAANKSLEAFSYSVSHDLRAPLRSISGFVDILQRSLGDKFDIHERNTAERIVNSVKHMEQLIDGLLAFSRMGKQQLLKTNVAIKKMVSDVCESFMEQKGDRQLIFHISDLPDIQADTTLIRQVWVNLISNAVKYTRKKEAAIIEIGFEEKQDNILYYVKDNGAGFNMEYAQKLFGVFQRMHLQKDFEGIGIGLSLVERIIEKHDGKIWADAKVDEGATFYFTLPAKH